MGKLKEADDRDHICWEKPDGCSLSLSLSPGLSFSDNVFPLSFFRFSPSLSPPHLSILLFSPLLHLHILRFQFSLSFFHITPVTLSFSFFFCFFFFSFSLFTTCSCSPFLSSLPPHPFHPFLPSLFLYFHFRYLYLPCIIYFY